MFWSKAVSFSVFSWTIAIMWLGSPFPLTPCGCFSIHWVTLVLSIWISCSIERNKHKTDRCSINFFIICFTINNMHCWLQLEQKYAFDKQDNYVKLSLSCEGMLISFISMSSMLSRNPLLVIKCKLIICVAKRKLFIWQGIRTNPMIICLH